MVIENSQHVIDFAKMTFVGGETTVSDIAFQEYREVVTLPQD
jgi:hypothetical protein